MVLGGEHRLEHQLVGRPWPAWRMGPPSVATPQFFGSITYIIYIIIYIHTEGSQYSGTPKSSILIGFSISNHLFGGTLIYGTLHITMAHGRPQEAGLQHAERAGRLGLPLQSLDRSLAQGPQEGS
jgi:hypothetical protein